MTITFGNDSATVTATPPATPTRPTVSYPDDRSIWPAKRFIWRPMEVAALPSDSSPRLRGRRVAVVGGSEASANTVLAALRRSGAVPHRLTAPNTAAPEDGVREFCSGAGPLDGIIDLNVEDPMDVARRRAWEAPLIQTIALLQECFDDWSAETDGDRLFYLAVTRLGGRHGYGDEIIGQPLGGLWAGLAKSLPREFDNVNVRVLDLPFGATTDAVVAEPLSDDAAQALCRELYRWGAFEIGHVDGRRYTLVADLVEEPEPRIEIDPGDVIVMSGGGRGIGFALAEALCRTHGCSVIVSGRGPVPDPDDPTLTLSEEGFRDYRNGRLIAAAAEGTIAAVRAELARVGWDRELLAKLARARSEGLDITYYQCDVTEPDQVRTLLQSAGPALVGVVHNAGVDSPVRLPAKQFDVVRRTVSVKVVGLLNLVDALSKMPALRFFNTAGSLAGRWGGMVGQLEYGAANDALSRIGMWASSPVDQPGRSRRLPVVTMCWPTWERLGIITNFEATLAYMSAIDVSEGLYHWQREILAAGSGERTFVGEFGKALLPNLLRGYPPSTGLSGVDTLVNRVLFLGNPVRFASGVFLEATLDVRADDLPCSSDFVVDGMPALPVSFVLEHVRSLGDWVQPSGPEQPLVAMRNVLIDVGALRLGAAGVRLRVIASRTQTSSTSGCVNIRVTRDDAQFVTRATLHYGAAPHDDETAQQSDEAATITNEICWRASVFRLGTWSSTPADEHAVADVESDRMRDLVMTSPPPRPELPLNQLETIVNALYVRRATHRVGHLALPSVDVVTATQGSSGPVRVDGSTWTASAPDGTVRLRLRQPHFTEGRS